MKFMMIFEGVDRATKVMNKIMAAERKAAASVKAGAKASEQSNSLAARAAEKMAAAYARVSTGARSAFNAVVSGAQAAARATVDLHRKTVALGKAGLSQIGDGAARFFAGWRLRPVSRRRPWAVRRSQPISCLARPPPSKATISSSKRLKAPAPRARRRWTGSPSSR